VNRPDYTVLLVDNASTVLDELERTVVSMGFRAVQVASTNPVVSAKRFWEQGGFDAAIVDLSMPDPAVHPPRPEGPTVGLDLIKWMTTTHPDALVVGMSGHWGATDEVDTKARGGAAFFHRGSGWREQFKALATSHAERRAQAPPHDEFERVLADESTLRAYGGQVVATYRGRIIASGEDYDDVLVALLELRDAPPIDDMTFVPVPPFIATADSDLAWCLTDSDAQQRAGGLVAAVAEGVVWGAGNSRAEASEAARHRADCPPPDRLTYVLIPHVQTS